MPAPTTNAQLFALAGQTLYGDNWQQPTARLLGWKLVNNQNRAVQRIAAAANAGEDYGINPAVLAELAEHLAAKSLECREVSRKIARTLPKP